MPAHPRPTRPATGERIGLPATAEHVTASVAVRAPARANLIGEHTDYNDGFVLPVALDLATHVVGETCEGNVILRSRQQPGEVVVDPATGAGPDRGWGRYVTAVVRALLDHGLRPRGIRGVVDSTVPLGGGLGSSAALEVAVAHAVLEQVPEPLQVARICSFAENAYVGVESGIMDQLASAAAVAGHALRIDCRDGTVSPVRIPAGLAVLVVHCGVQRALRHSPFNQRREECRRAAAALGVRSLRDASLDALAAAADRMDNVLHRRARHVVTENWRVGEAARALAGGETERLRKLFAASHESLARDFEVSTPELDTLVDVAMRTEGVVAARLTGAGFGGCTVNLVQRDVAHDCGVAILRRYEGRTGRRGRHWVSNAAQGAGELRPAGQ
jgi:galactokinase